MSPIQRARRRAMRAVGRAIKPGNRRYIAGGGRNSGSSGG